MSKVLVMMSGGVDSSVAAALLKDAGHEVTGITLRLADTPADSERVGGCCSLSDVEDARCVAHCLDIPHYSLNGRELFRNTVLKNFIEEYTSGRTPNPCYRCNEWVKFSYVLKWAESLDFDFIATGHYARMVEYEGSRFLARGRDRAKDQTYFLAAISPEALPRLLFPLGDMTKAEVRQIAERKGLTTADKSESQELCFADDYDYRTALEAKGQGDIVSLDGKTLGKHEGITGFTIGQRKGIHLGGGPFYVTRIDRANNRVYVGSESDLYSSSVEVAELNLFGPLPVGAICTAMPRYRHPGAQVAVESITEGILTLRFIRPERALTPGQALVLYDKDRVIAGSIIDKVFAGN